MVFLEKLLISEKHWKKDYLCSFREKNIYYRKIRIKPSKYKVICAILEKKILSRKIMYFFGFLPPTNENKKKKT